MNITHKKNHQTLRHNIIIDQSSMWALAHTGQKKSNEIYIMLESVMGFD
jgi:hypothetical protein